MSLARHQQAFAEQLRASGDLPESEGQGLEIYRNAYRERLFSALAVSFERTRQWVGDDAFSAAARHLVITSPPSNWTLDAYGAHFPALLDALFAQNGEVAELAWLEWHLQQAFAATDLPELSGSALAQSELADGDWECLRFQMAAGFAARPVAHDCAKLWQALCMGDAAASDLKPIEPATLVVWRKGLSPHYRILAQDEFSALDSLLKGETFGAVAAQISESRAADLGQWFAQWLSEGLFSAFSC